jgi:lauroyl/myristoyl acyltransferase
MMIVGSNEIMRQAQGLGEEFAPDANERVRYVCAQEPLVLARSLEALNQGSLVSTLMELSSLKFAKTAEVKFLGWTVRVPYGIPYLAAMTKRSIVPAVLMREKGMRYRLRFLEALPAPARDRASIMAATQNLYSVLEREVRHAPEQWAGWTTLESNLGIDLGRPVLNQVPAVS